MTVITASHVVRTRGPVIRLPVTAGANPITRYTQQVSQRDSRNRNKRDHSRFAVALRVFAGSQVETHLNVVEVDLTHELHADLEQSSRFLWNALDCRTILLCKTTA